VLARDPGTPTDVPLSGSDVVVGAAKSLVVAVEGEVVLTDVGLSDVVVLGAVALVVVLGAVDVAGADVVVVVPGVEVWYSVALVKIIAVVYVPTTVACKPWRHWKVTSY
jgi:hypothetical protein